MSDILIEALGNADRPNLNRLQFRGIPTPIDSSERDLRQMIGALQENVERLQDELKISLLSHLSITDLTKIPTPVAGVPLLSSAQATALRDEKEREAAPLQQSGGS